MLDAERNAERQFLGELLAATRSGRVAWTGTVIPGCCQFVAGDHLVAIREEDGAPAVALHHVSGHRLGTLRPAQFAADDEHAGLEPVFAELLELAHIHALGLRRRWRQLAKHVSSVEPNTKPVA